MEPKRYIATIGRMGAGKETTWQFIRDLVQPTTVGIHHFSDPLNETLQLWHLERTRHSQQTVSRVLREGFGQNIIAEVIRQRAEANPAAIVVIDGLRRPVDLEILGSLPDLIILALEAEPGVRFARIRLRNSRSGDMTKTWDQFVDDESAECEQLIDVIACQANCRIDNSGSVEELRANVQSFLEKTAGLTLW